VWLEDYYERLLEEIREIRLRERRFYQKITDIYATSVDYNKDAPTTKAFFAKVQNKLHYAIHGQTAAEVILRRPDSTKSNMGLTSWEKAPEGKILKSHCKKLSIQRRTGIVGTYRKRLSGLCGRPAHRKIPMTMEDWAKRLDLFLEFDERRILEDKGRVPAELAKAHAESVTPFILSGEICNLNFDDKRNKL